MLRGNNWEYSDPIETAPRDTDVMLIVEDGSGAFATVPTNGSWLGHLRKDDSARVKPVKWRLSRRASQETK